MPTSNHCSRRTPYAIPLRCFLSLRNQTVKNLNAGTSPLKSLPSCQTHMWHRSNRTSHSIFYCPSNKCLFRICPFIELFQDHHHRDECSSDTCARSQSPTYTPNMYSFTYHQQKQNVLLQASYSSSIINHYIRCSFEFPVKVGVKESIVNAPLV
jgi:hypothetical protein